MKRICNFIHGKFGRYTLKSAYREMWVRTMYCLIGVIGILILCGMLKLWGYVVSCINYVVWGIS